MTEDEMVGWHHGLDGHESEKAPGVGDGQGSLACCSSWVCKESDMTERLNWLYYREEKGDAVHRWWQLGNWGITSGSIFCKVLESIENVLGGKKVKDFRVIDYEGKMRSRAAEGYSVLCFFT